MLVELQKSLAKLARRNADLNRMSDRVSVVHADLKDLATGERRRRGSGGTVASIIPEATTTARKCRNPEDPGLRPEIVITPQNSLRSLRQNPVILSLRIRHSGL